MAEPHLTDQQRRALHQAAGKGGVSTNLVRPDIAELLIACGLLTEHDHTNTATWTLLATKEGRALLHQPIRGRDPVRLLGNARMPHPDPQRRGTVPEPERMDPLPHWIKQAREEGVRQREAFRRDLEAERARRKAQRVPQLRQAARARRDAA